MTTDSINVVQPVTFTRNRYITKVALSFDGRDRTVVSLNETSRDPVGQTISFPKRRFSSLQLEVVAANFGRQSRYNGLSGVGFSEVRIPGVKLSEYLRLPTDLLTAAGAASLSHPLILQLTRDRANPAEAFKQDAELGMNRTFSLPTARSFGLTGTARISPLAPDEQIDAALGRPVGPTVVRADSSGHLPGDLTNRGSSVFDGDPKTVWSTGFGDQVGNWVRVRAPQPVTAASIGLDVLADGRHSVPTKVHLEVDGRAQPALTLPTIIDRPVENATTHVTLRFAAVTGRTFKLRHRRRPDREGAGLPKPPPPRDAHRICRGGPRRAARAGVAGQGALDVSHGPAHGERQAGRGLAVGRDVGRNQAGRFGRLAVRRCQPRPAGGEHRPDRCARPPHRRRSGPDRMASAPGGTATSATAVAAASMSATDGASPPREAPAPAPGSAAGTDRWAGSPQVSVGSQTRTSYAVHVTGAQPGKPFWLVLGQSLSPGWTANATGVGDLGKPRLVDGYANGWLVTPSSSTFDVTLTWTPQTKVWIALVLSAVALLVCLILALWPFGRRRPNRLDAVPADQPLPDLVSPLARWDTAAGARVMATLRVVPTGPGPDRRRCRRGHRAAHRARHHPTRRGASSEYSPRSRFAVNAAGRCCASGPVACLLISAAYVVELQWHYKLPLNGSWPATFSKVATISWLAVGLLTAEVITEMVQRRGRGDRNPA